MHLSCLFSYSKWSILWRPPQMLMGIKKIDCLYCDLFNSKILKTMDLLTIFVCYYIVNDAYNYSQITTYLNLIERHVLTLQETLQESLRQQQQ